MKHNSNHSPSEMNVPDICKKKAGLTIVIPAYNEERRIGKTLEAYANFFTSSFGQDFTILVVLNGCKDKTEEVVLQIAQSYLQVQYVTFPQKLGKGGAVIEGLKLASGNLVCFVDADNMVQPSATVKLLHALDLFDIAIGSRWKSTGSSKTGRPWKRRLVSFGVQLLVRLFLRLEYADTQCGAKAIRGEALDIIIDDLSERGWAFDLDFLVSAERRGLKIKEIPVAWNHVEEGSKVRMLVDLPRDLLSGIRIWKKRYKKL